MSNGGDRKIIIEKLIVEETRKASERLGYLNNLAHTCLKKGFTSAEYIEADEKIWRNAIKICESHLKNSFSRKERYENEVAKAPNAVCANKRETNSF